MREDQRRPPILRQCYRDAWDGPSRLLMWLREGCQEWTSEEHVRGTVVISQVGGKMSVSKDIGAREEN